MAAGSAASAATIDLTNVGNVTGNATPTVTFSNGGITGTILAGCDLGGTNVNCDGVGVVPVVRTTNNGMGVRSANNITVQLDTSNGGEFLTFLFDTAVDLLNIDFHALSTGEFYDLFVNGAQVADNQNSDPWTTGLFNVTSLTIKADGSGTFLVRSLEAVIAQRQIAPVPVPASGALLLAGLGALAWRRRTVH